MTKLNMECMSFAEDGFCVSQLSVLTLIGSLNDSIYVW